MLLVRGLVFGLAALAGCVPAARAPEIERVEPAGYRAIAREGERRIYLYTPSDSVRARVVCRPGVALEACGKDLRLGDRLQLDRRLRGQGVLVFFGALEGPQKLEGLELAPYLPARAIEAEADETRAAALEQRIASPETAPLDLLDAMKERARLFARQGKSDRYRETQEARAERALQLGLVSEASDAWSASAYFAHRSRDFEAMDRLLDRAEELDRREGFELGLIRSALVRSYADIELGRHRTALRMLEDAARRAWELGYDEDLAWLQKALGPLYGELGMPEKALAQLHRLEPYFQRSDERARLAFLIDLAWVELEAIARGAIPPELDRPARRLEEALVLARRLKSSDDEANILVNSLYADYLAKDSAQARARLVELASLPRDSLNFARPFLAIVEATLALQSDDPARAIELLSAPPEASPYLWRALGVRARAHWRRGDIQAARRDFLAAQEELETLALQADLQESRARFFANAAELRDEALAFFTTEGPIEEAFLAAERARAHVLLSLELQVRSERLAPNERLVAAEHRRKYLELRAKFQDRAKERVGLAASALSAFDAATRALDRAAQQELSALYAQLDQQAPVMTRRIAGIDALWEVLPEDAELISFALTRSSTIAFSVRKGRVRATELRAGQSIGTLPTAGLRHVYFVAGGAISVERLTAEALPIALRDRTATILPYAGALLRPRSKVTGAPLVVADPHSDLIHARREGERVAERLSDARLLTGDQAGERAVREALASARLFHFAGHGQLGAEDPWSSRLELSDGALTLESLLISAPGVRNVVLSGCETGRGSSLSRELAIGLPEAFLMAGAETVLATTRKVEDAAAARFIDQFYAAGGAEYPARAFRAAFLATEDDSFYLMGRGE